MGLLQEQSSQKIISAKQCLSPAYLRLTQADVAFMSGGDVMVACSDGTVGSAVQCFQVNWIFFLIGQFPTFVMPFVLNMIRFRFNVIISP